MKNKLQELISIHTTYTPVLCELIKSLLISERIKFHVVEQRTKERDSVENKISRKKIDDFDSITDFSGIRVILYYQDDIDKVDSLIRSNFAIDEPNSINKAHILENNEFGYLSIHYIVQLDKKRKGLPEWKQYSKLKAEIQVRTVLQHSWASISHELSYKRSIDIPKELSRKLFRLAGLFELADEQFLTIRNEHEDLEDKIQSISDEKEFLNIQINSVSLKEAMSKSKSIFKEIEKIAVKHGFVSNGFDGSNLSSIILLSDILNIRTIGSLEEIIKNNPTKTEALFTNLAPSDESPWSGDRSFFSELALLSQMNTDQIEQYFSQTDRAWSDDVINVVTEAIKN